MGLSSVCFRLMRRRLLLGAAVLLGLLIITAVAIWLSYGSIGAWVIRDKVLPKIERRLGRQVTVGDIEVERGTVTLRDVQVAGAEGGLEPWIQIESVVAKFDYRASWRGNVILHDVTVDGLTTRLVRRLDGTDNFRDVMDRLRSKPKGDSKGSGKGSRMRPRSLRVINASFDFEDQIKGITMTARDASVMIDRTDNIMVTLGRVEAVPAKGPSASVTNVIVETSLRDPLRNAHAVIGGGEIRLWDGMTLSGINGDVQQGTTPGHLVVDLSGSYGGANETLWTAKGWVEPTQKRGEIAIEAERFTLNRIAHVLEGSMLVDYNDTSIDAELVVEIDQGKAELSGKLNLSGLSLFHEKLAQETIRDVAFDSELSAAIDTKAMTLDVSSLKLRTKGVDYHFAGSAALPGGLESDGTRREFARVRGRVIVPEAHCQKVLESIPAAFVPKLQGFQLKGPFSADVQLAIDWSDLDITELGGYVNLPKCKIVSPNEEFDAKRILDSFEHQIMVGPEEFESVEIGMASDNYVQIIDISSYFLKAVMTQEDSRFYDHKGFIPREFKSALIRNLKAGRFKFGASSITMQMVKNVFLYRDKTMSRKLQELFLTWYVEETLDKNRILEIYVNAIEYGPGIYGIKQATELYLEKHPRDLDPREAAFFADLLPAPRRRYFQYCRGKLSRRGRNKNGRILRNMLNRKRLTQEEHDEALESEIDFNPTKRKDICRKLPDW